MCGAQQNAARMAAASIRQSDLHETQGSHMLRLGRLHVFADAGLEKNKKKIGQGA